MRTCTKCKLSLPFDCFSKDSRRGYAARCKSCRKEEVQLWREANREKVNKWERDRYKNSSGKWAGHVLRKYGLTVKQYQQMSLSQNHACAICLLSSKEQTKVMAVDHDHQTGKVRGLLCARCNRLLGCADDKPDRLKRAAQYLIDAFVNSEYTHTP